jgi:hypothetical protein
MTRIERVAGAALLAVTAAAGPIEAAEASAIHRSIRADVDLGAPLPPDLVSPEGRTRWQLADLRTGARRVHEILPGAEADTLFVVERRLASGSPEPRKTTTWSSTEAARRWLVPHLADPEVASPERRELELRVGGDLGAESYRVEVRRVGLGWVHLPSGPHEAVLQRALVSRRAPGSRVLEPFRLGHRFIDPRLGVVAEVWGPVDPTGTRRLSIDEAVVVERVERGATGLRLYVDEHQFPFCPNAQAGSRCLTPLRYGWDRGGGTTVASVTPVMPRSERSFRPALGISPATTP